MSSENILTGTLRKMFAESSGYPMTESSSTKLFEMILHLVTEFQPLESKIW
jgi:hypothetical protein